MELVHGTSVFVAGHGVLLRGASGSGKSDLALRLIDGGALLIADDYTELRLVGDAVVMSAPPPIARRLEVRGLGIVNVPTVATARLSLLVDLAPAATIERLPVRRRGHVRGRSFPVWSLAPFEASAAAKLRLAVASLSGHNPHTDREAADQ